MDKTVEILRAAAEPTRMRILSLLVEGEMSVSELVKVLGQSQPRLSRHLKILSLAGLLERLSEGAWAYYRLARGGDAAGELAHILEIIPANDKQLEADRASIREIREARNAAAQEYFRKNAGDWDTMARLNINEDEVANAAARLLPLRGEYSLLDMGTGTGKMLERFAPRVASAVGVDMNPEMLKVARANAGRLGLANVTLRQGDINSLPFADESFDAITCHQVMHYLDHPADALREAARTLKKGGHLLLADLSPHDIEELRQKHAHHWLGFADGDVKGWISAAGLQARATVHLRGDPLSVTLWLAEKEGGNAGQQQPDERVS